MLIFLLFISVFLGAGAGSFLLSNRSLHRLLLTFSGAFLLTVTLLEIFPHLFADSSHTIGLYVLLGVLIQIFLESFSQGAEHGHMHLHGTKSFPLSIFLGLFIHAFIEGMPIAHNSSSFIWVLLVHKIPVAMILYTFIAKLTENQRHRWLFIFVFSLASPLGWSIGRYLPQTTTPIILAVVSGIFLHISTVIIFESSDGHKLKIQKIIALLLGFCIAYLSLH